MLESNWSEDGWSVEKTLLQLHRFVGVGGGRNIFRKDAPDGIEDEDEVKGEVVSSRSKRSANDINEEEFVAKYREYMFNVATSLGAEASNITKRELNDALELGVALRTLLSTEKFPMNNKSEKTSDESSQLRTELDLFRWLELFDKFKVNFKSRSLDYSISVRDNFKKLKELYPKRVFANYLVWRIIDFSPLFLHEEATENLFKLASQAYGLLDKDQRWKLCTKITNTYASLASSSLYIREYFPPESRRAAEEMVNKIVEEFKRTIETSSWMDESTKQKAIKRLESLKKVIGYDERLQDIAEVENFYSKLTKDFDGNFFYTGLQLSVQIADKTFKHKYRKQPDWTLYSLPTSTKALYNQNDNTMCTKL